jgi:hypothetical protein
MDRWREASAQHFTVRPITPVELPELRDMLIDHEKGMSLKRADLHSHCFSLESHDFENSSIFLFFLFLL